MNVCMCPARTVWFLFYLGCHRSAVSLSALNVFPLTQTIAPKRGSNPSFSSPTHKGGPSPTNTPVFPPSSFTLPSFSWFYIFFSSGQDLLSTVMVFCMHFCVWRCIPLTSVERDVLYIHLLLLHLVLPFDLFVWSIQVWNIFIFIISNEIKVKIALEISNGKQ